jgi:hypothetical protein
MPTKKMNSNSRRSTMLLLKAPLASAKEKSATTGGGGGDGGRLGGGGGPSRRRHSVASGLLLHHQTASAAVPPPSLDRFVQHGSRLQSMFGEAMQQVKRRMGDTSASKRTHDQADNDAASELENPDEPPRRRQRLLTMADESEYTVELARQKTSEAAVLQLVSSAYMLIFQSKLNLDCCNTFISSRVLLFVVSF